MTNKRHLPQANLPEVRLLLEAENIVGAYFLAWYNEQHDYSGLNLLMPASVHFHEAKVVSCYLTHTHVPGQSQPILARISLVSSLGVPARRIRGAVADAQ